MRSSLPCADQQLIGDNRILFAVTPAKSPRSSRPVCASMWKSVVESETPDTPRVGPWPVGHPACVFLFFSSRLGCLGSLVLSVLLTLLLLWIFRLI
jgi:hypothetical protein